MRCHFCGDDYESAALLVSLPLCWYCAARDIRTSVEASDRRRAAHISILSRPVGWADLEQKHRDQRCVNCGILPNSDNLSPALSVDQLCVCCVVDNLKATPEPRKPRLPQRYRVTVMTSHGITSEYRQYLSTKPLTVGQAVASTRAGYVIAMTPSKRRRHSVGFVTMVRDLTPA